MQTIKSVMSTEVKAITLLGSVVLLSIGMVLFIISDSLWLKITSVLAMGTFFYMLLLTSLRNIQIDQRNLILNYRIGRKKIALNEITGISKLEFDNLNITYGSKGIFGYNDMLMGSSRAHINDRKNIVKIRTQEKDYIFSISNPDLIIKLITKRRFDSQFPA